VILDPPGAVPVCLALTGSLTKVQRHVAAWRASLVAVFVIGMFALFGRSILDYLHISIRAPGAAGLLLSARAVQMVADSVRAFVGGEG